MYSILSLRDSIKRIYGKYDMFITPVLRFLLAFVCFMVLQNYLKLNTVFSGLPVILVCSMFCIFFSSGCISLVFSIIMLGNMFEVSYVMTAFMFILLLAVWLLYFGFRPGKGIIIALVPVAFILKIPFVIPLILGLSGSIVSCIPVAIGTIIWFSLKYFHENAGTMVKMPGTSEIVSAFTDILNAVLKNKYMFFIIAIFAFSLIIVYILSHMSFNYCQITGVAAGTLVLVFGILFGTKFSGPSVSISDVIGLAVSILVSVIYELIFYSADFKNTEFLRFQDDDYYYYVKAVPKIKASDKNEGKEKIN